MPQRQWEVNEPDPVVPEGWEPGEPVEIDANDFEGLGAALDAQHAILKYIGGVVSVGARREEIAPGLFVTRSYIFQWESYAPARRQERPAEEPEPETQLETAEV